MVSLSKTFPNWWYSSEDDQPTNAKNATVEEKLYRPNNYDQDIYNIDFNLKKKKHNKSSNSSKHNQSDNQIIRELSSLLIEKGDLAERLEMKLSNLTSNYEELKSEVQFMKLEYSKIYNENCILKDIVNRLDTKSNKVEDKNSLFLSKDAPQEIVDTVWKTLSKTYHPDCGGSEEKMKLINLDRDEFYKQNGWK